MKEVTIQMSEPELDLEETLYLKAFFNTNSHSKAHKVVCPTLKNHVTNNKFSKRHNIKYYIAKAIQNELAACNLTSENVLSLLLQEAMYKGKGASHTARVNALGLLGKNLGLFSDREEADKVVYNIINYTSSDKEPNIKNIKQEIKSNVIPISNLAEKPTIIDYK